MLTAALCHLLQLVVCNRKKEKMKESHHDPNEHKGEQPIRVLSSDIIHWFQNTYPGFKDVLEYEINNNGLQKEIRYIIGEERIRVAAKVDGDKKISIGESFLSYLWTVSYGLVVLFDEGVQNPRIEKGWKLTNEIQKKIDDAQKLFDYGLSLISNYSKWDTNNLPNPECYDPAENEYIEKINLVYHTAVNLVVVHEFGHVFLGHIDQDIELAKQGKRSTLHDRKNDEYAADKYAFDTLMQGADSVTNKHTTTVGMVAGLASLIFFSSSLDGHDHPDPDERVKIVLEALHLDEEDNLWGIACLALKLWANHHKIDIGWPPVVDTYKDLFYLTLKNLRSAVANKV